MRLWDRYKNNICNQRLSFAFSSISEHGLTKNFCDHLYVSESEKIEKIYETNFYSPLPAISNQSHKKRNEIWQKNKKLDSIQGKNFF